MPILTFINRFVLLSIFQKHIQHLGRSFDYKRNMDTRIMRFFLLVIITAFQNPFVVEGFHTDHCDHDKFTHQAQKFIKCLHRTLVDSTQDLLIDYHDQLLENNYVYDISNGTKIFLSFEVELGNCWQKYMGKCFNDSPSEIETEIFESITQLTKTNFNAGTIEKWQKEIKDKLENMTVGEVQNLMAELDKEYIVNRDHKCLDEKLSHEFENDLKSPQCDDTLQGISDVYQSLVANNVPQQFSICTTMANILGSCLRENKCISQQEVELSKHLIWAVFQIPMDTILKVKEVFGSLKFLNTYIYKTTFKSGNEVLLTPRQATDWEQLGSFIIIEIMNWIIDDYETPACKAIVDYGLTHLEVKKNNNQVIFLFF